ncbi:MULTISPECIES: hypothetical protein [unclassified Sphingopyxis]|uniref:hypothetical protein n=1 Tax=unclassified Sphingopyxis TaxID=2614943 RepID=UPI0007369DDB|nr:MULTISPECIES: hypothetical protein [unclassified Sphingopyxis]KTE38040.1 hypothetical protein ATE62_11870 [Sphingopyxis sp. HIX]KTE84652.1 hypothetical protein ATE72_07880 [Sphingopyxis sp. HXXIV]
MRSQSDIDEVAVQRGIGLMAFEALWPVLRRRDDAEVRGFPGLESWRARHALRYGMTMRFVGELVERCRRLAGEEDLTPAERAALHAVVEAFDSRRR